MDIKLHDIQALLTIIKAKHEIDQNHDWSLGSATYFQELKEEIEEVGEELKDDRWCYLEDELGDVLWDYLNLLYNLEVEDKISVGRVFKRATDKYDQRISAITNGISWASIKEKQKMALKRELADSRPEKP